MVQKVSGGVGDDIQREKGHFCFKVYSRTLDLLENIIFVSFLKFSLFSNLCQKKVSGGEGTELWVCHPAHTTLMYA
jgi:hypothetical protein